MPIKVVWGEGLPYAIVETPAEALELIKLASSNGMISKVVRQDSPPQPFDLGSEEQRINNFFSEINKRARSFLGKLSGHPAGVRGEAIAEEIQEPTNAFGGMLGGMAKIAKKHQFSLNDFLLSEIRSSGTERFRFLRPQPLLLKYAGKLGK